MDAPMRLYLGLVHFPVYDKNGREISSAITSTDLHDISRLAKTYGLKGFYVITPLKDQQELAKRIVRHWTEGFGASYNPHRRQALELVSIVPSLQSAVEDIGAQEGELPLVITTDASRKGGRPLTYEGARKIVRSNRLAFVLLGTGWGLAQSLIRESDYLLDPIEGGTDYNHLSVRTAAGIIVDRLVARD